MGVDGGGPGGAAVHGGIPVVDAHVHVNRFDLMREGPRAVIEKNPTFHLMERFMRDPEAFLEHMDREGVWQAWLINYCAREVMGYGREVNDWVASYVEADPERLVAVGGYDPVEDGAGDRAVDRLREQGVRVLKVHPVHQRLSPDAHRDGTRAGARMAAAYARCQDLRMPVVFHTGTSIFPGADNSKGRVAPMAHVCADFPDLPVVLAHGGRPHETLAALGVLRDHGNARLDLSSLPPKRVPEWFPGLEAAADRVLWGSDWPGPKVPGMGANVEAFLALGYPEAVNRRVLHGNAVALLRAVV